MRDPLEAPSQQDQQDRIVVLDVMRGVAVLGILLMNITGFGLPLSYDDPTNWGGHEGANLGAWRINALLFEGTMRGLFTLLFGASALLFLQRHETNSSATLHYRRTLWLIAFGLVNGYLLLWDGDILFFYGVIGLMLYFFRNMSPSKLIMAAALAIALQTSVTLFEWAGYQDMSVQAQQAQEKRAAGRILNDDEQEAIEEFALTSRDYKPSHIDLESMVLSIRASYSSAFDAISERTWYVESRFFFRHGLLECLGMMLLGMALLKWGVLSGTAPLRTYLALTIGGYALGLGVNVFEITSLERSGFSTDAMVTSYLTYDLGRIPTTLAHMALIVLIYRAQILPAALRMLAAVGRMALTNYLLQSAIAMFLFTGAGLALYGQLERHELYYIVVPIWLVQSTASVLWLKHFRYGPAEWLWRSLTYWELQPMQRSAPSLPLPRRAEEGTERSTL